MRQTVRAVYFQLAALIFGFYETDHGPNFKAGKMVMPLADYVRGMAAELAPGSTVNEVYVNFRGFWGGVQPFVGLCGP